MKSKLKNPEEFKKWKNPKVYSKFCKRCGELYESTEPSLRQCPKCWASHLDCYDPSKTEEFVQEILSWYVMETKFTLTCKKCGETFETNKRGVYNRRTKCPVCERKDKWVDPKDL